MRKAPENLENLRSVLHTISQIRKQGVFLSLVDILTPIFLDMNFEVEVKELEERSRIRLIFANEDDLEISEDDYKEVQSVQESWKALNEEADEVEVDIIDAKKHFSHLTQNQVQISLFCEIPNHYFKAEEFVKKTEAFWEEYDQNGPGKCEKSLAEGVTALKTFNAKLTSYMETRDELLLSQRLFDVESSDFKYLNKVRKYLV